MMLCPARQTLIRDDDKKTTAEALLFGTMTHWRIEQEMLGESGFDFDRMSSRLKELYYEDTNGGDLLEVVSKRKAREFINEVMVAYEAWVEQVEPMLPDDEPIIEQTMSAEVFNDNEYIVEMTGTPDVVYPVSKLIVDWKTAGRNWNVDKVQGQVQPWAYSLLAKYNGYPIERFEFWVYDRSTESWWAHVHHLEDLDNAHQALLDQTVAFALQVERGIPVYTPSGSGWKSRGWHCSPQYCDQWGRCNGKYLVADGRANEPALDPISKGWS